MNLNVPLSYPRPGIALLTAWSYQPRKLTEPFQQGNALRALPHRPPGRKVSLPDGLSYQPTARTSSWYDPPKARRVSSVSWLSKFPADGAGARHNRPREKMTIIPNVMIHWLVIELSSSHLEEGFC